MEAQRRRKHSRKRVKMPGRGRCLVQELQDPPCERRGEGPAEEAGSQLSQESSEAGNEPGIVEEEGS